VSVRMGFSDHCFRLEYILKVMVVQAASAAESSSKVVNASPSPPALTGSSAPI